MEISIIVPVRNEDKNIKTFLRRTENVLNKIEKSYNEIFPPSEQKKYEQSLLTPVEKKRIEFQKKNPTLLNDLLKKLER